MKKPRTLEEMQKQPELIERFFRSLRMKGFGIPCPPGCAFIAFKQFFGKKFAS